MTSSAPKIGAGPRLLLRRLREVMAAPVSAQARLDDTVSMIATNMVAEVCSIYIRRAGDQLELFATKGLKSDAVHQTRLQLGEGLVGEIARRAEPLNLSDAPRHPKFAYRPETGEDPYHSFLGVPILRGGHVLGVLVVQNKLPRHYDEEELEALQTVAMVIAEIVASGQLIQLDETVIDSEVTPMLPYRQKGLGLAGGISVGRVVFHAAPVQVVNLIADDVMLEMGRLREAISELRQSIDDLLAAADARLTDEPREVLEAYRLLAHDRGWLSRMEEAIRNGLTAEAAVEQVHSDNRAKLTRQRDPYLKDRLHDLDDLTNRLLRQLVGVSSELDKRKLSKNAIVFARNLGPAALLDYDTERLGGVVVEEGSPNSHAAIVARALGIPMVGMLDELLEHVKEGDWCIIDGENGEVHVRPSPKIRAAYDEKVIVRKQRQAQFDALRDEPAITLDGQHITLNMNAGLLVDLAHLDEVGADGIGLFRTELQFMISSTMPRLEAQTTFYRQVIEAADPRPVVFRTLDLGGDKVLPYGRYRKEENPALGLRAIRLALSRPGLLRYQLRALILAAAGRDLNLMFPMVAEVEEYRRARALLELEIERLKRLNKPKPESIRVGCMIEVPSIAWQLKALIPYVDFVSVGSNDLLQFFFASDRNNPMVGNSYDFLSPSILSFLRNIVLECENEAVPLTLCGEVAGRPLEAMALLGLGFRTISMPAASIGPAKLMAQKLHLGHLEQVMSGLFDRADHSVRPVLLDFAKNTGVPI